MKKPAASFILKNAREGEPKRPFAGGPTALRPSLPVWCRADNGSSFGEGRFHALCWIESGRTVDRRTSAGCTRALFIKWARTGHHPKFPLLAAPAVPP